MEKFVLKRKQFAGFCLLTLFSLLINYGGSLLASTNKLPVWLDSAGTALAAYLGGPVCGALVGLAANLIKFEGERVCGFNTDYTAVKRIAEEFIKVFGQENKDRLLRPSIFNPEDEDKYMLDLWQACKLVFLEAGVPEENIEITDYCTRCNPDLFYSHRIMGANRGSLAAFISL